MFEDESRPYVELSREHYVQEQLALGYEVHEPKSNELFLDIDSEDAFNHFLQGMESFKSYMHAVGGLKFIKDPTVTACLSKSNRGLHIRVLVPFELDHSTRIALQCALGSDRIRELLSALRHVSEDTKPTLFVETFDPTIINLAIFNPKGFDWKVKP